MDFNFKEIIFSILFLKGTAGSTVDELSKLTKLSKQETIEVLESLEKDSQSGNAPFELKIYGNSTKLSLRSDVSRRLSNVINNKEYFKLPRAVLEVLTIIAYKQPSTKPTIEKIRGVDSESSIRKLLELGLISEAGRATTPGMPILYQTTDWFLEKFNLKSLKDLPKLEKELEPDQIVQLGNIFGNE